MPWGRRAKLKAKHDLKPGEWPSRSMSAHDSDHSTYRPAPETPHVTNLSKGLRLHGSEDQHRGKPPPPTSAVSGGLVPRRTDSMCMAFPGPADTPFSTTVQALRLATDLPPTSPCSLTPRDIASAGAPDPGLQGEPDELLKGRSWKRDQ